MSIRVVPASFCWTSASKSANIPDVAEAELTPLPRLWYQDELAAALHTTTIFLMQIEYVLALEVPQALLAPGKSVYFVRFVISLERREVFDAGIMTTA